MGTKSRSDISNSAIRMLLQSAGAFYDEARGYKRFSTNGTEWKEVIKLFSNACCYCGVKLTPDNMTDDHLVPINKKSLGLHAWGNIVPCCRHCNKEKHFGEWRVFLKSKSSRELYKKRAGLILRYQKKYGYNPNIELKDIANNLYEDVGQVSSTLINLRLKQAEAVIHSMLTER
ncbi:MAG: HNH endonuclease signature motif containing protein [Patescibacteria group bacterium]